MIFSYLVFAVLGFIMISTFTARYNQKYLEKHFASALRRESNLIATSFGTNYYSSDMTLTQFQKQLYAIGSYLNADIYVVDTDGKILVTSTESWNATDSETIPAFDILDFGSDYYTINHFYNLYDSDVLSVYTPVTHNYSVSCYVLICQPLTDISDLQYADTLTYMAVELNALENDQHKFVSNVSHDFRSPLTSIKGYAQAMADGTIPPELQEKYLNVIIFEAERLEKLTQSLLELNKYGSKGTYLNLTVFDLNQLIKRTILMFEGRCKEKCLSFDLILTGDELYVKADSAKIDQVMHNLIDNAFKFSNADSVITIETTLRNGKVFVSVKDRGIGIPKDSIGRIWERFYKKSFMHTMKILMSSVPKGSEPNLSSPFPMQRMRINFFSFSLQ